jgi:hypothetical protein
MLTALRLARRLQLCLLLAFMGSITAAAASPWLGGGHRLALVCSDTAGSRLIVVDADGSTSPSAHLLECPLCLPHGDTVCEFHAAAAPAPCGDAPVIGALGDRPSSSSALRPPARAPPCPHNSSTR